MEYFTHDKNRTICLTSISVFLHKRIHYVYRLSIVVAVQLCWRARNPSVWNRNLPLSDLPADTWPAHMSVDIIFIWYS